MHSPLPLAAIMVLVCACAPAQSVPSPTLEAKVAEIAKVMNTVTPKRLEGGLALDSVIAKGRTLVLRMSGLPKWRPRVSDAEAGKMLGVAICDRAAVKALVAEGALLMIEGTTPGGETLPSLPICVA